MLYQAYLFDFDYTLADSERGIVMCFQYVFEKYGYENVSVEAIKATIGYTIEDAISRLVGITDSEKIYKKMRRVYSEKSEEVMAANTTLYPATIPLIQAIKEKGGKVAIVSTKRSQRIRESLLEFEIDDLVDAVIGGEAVSEAKPSPEGIFKALDALKVDRENTLYVGDSIVDSQAAQAAAIDFAGVLTGTTPREVFENAPYVKIAEDLNMIFAEKELY